MNENFLGIMLFLGVGTWVVAKDDGSPRYGLDIDLPGSSCADIYNKNPASHGRSGYYILKTDRLLFTQCDMELECGGIKGGWMRIADINTGRGDQCPSGWSAHKSYCIGGEAAGCYYTHFSTASTSYSKVCGKVVGYQKGSMDGFYPSALEYGRITEVYKPVSSSRSLDGPYVDGISITCGSPRKHVWTYAVGNSDNGNNPLHNCPCATHPGPDPPIYVGSNFYCESGNNGLGDQATLYTEDPLWDGDGCLTGNSCCYQAGAPWFFRQFPKAVSGDVEVRICHDQNFADEGVAVEQLQLYVQ